MCRFPYDYTGPRYDRIAGELFEVQVRTLCMHAWAAVSHYLDYKSESDIPDDMKKGLNALSGLFYVADDQYEKLYGESVQSKKHAKSMSEDDLIRSELNLDTFSAYISNKFPDRKKADSASISQLLDHLIDYGISTLEAIDKVVQQGLPKTIAGEGARKSKGGVDLSPYYDLAMTRLSLYNGDKNFQDFEEAVSRLEVSMDFDEPEAEAEKED